MHAKVSLFVDEKPTFTYKSAFIPINFWVKCSLQIGEIDLENPRASYAEYGFRKQWFSGNQGWITRLGISIMLRPGKERCRHRPNAVPQ